MTARLLRQNFFVAVRTKLLWVICVLAFAVSAAVRFDFNRLGATPLLGVVYAFFAAVYLGDAGTSGRLDGQIIRGASRPQIYLAEWLTVTACCVLTLLFTLAGDLAAALITGSTAGSFLGWLAYVAGMIINAAVYSALFTFICLLAAGRRPGRATIALIICAAVLIAMMIWLNELQNALMEPEFYLPQEMNGGFYIYQPIGDPSTANPSELIPNESYVPEPTRTTYWEILRCMPLSQGIMLADLPDAQPVWEDVQLVLFVLIDGCILIAVLDALGILLFSRRELD